MATIVFSMPNEDNKTVTIPNDILTEVAEAFSAGTLDELTDNMIAHLKRQVIIYRNKTRPRLGADDITVE